MSKFTIKKYGEEDIENVVSFNKRLRLKGANIFFPELPVSQSLPCINGRDIYRENFLCIDSSNLDLLEKAKPQYTISHTY